MNSQHMNTNPKGFWYKSNKSESKISNNAFKLKEKHYVPKIDY